MYPRNYLLLLIAALGILLVACGDDDQPESESADDSRTDGHEAAQGLTLEGNAVEVEFEQVYRERVMPVRVQGWDAPVVQQAQSQEELEGAWEGYRLSGEMPEIQWDSQVVFFHGLRESGSCPYEVVGFSIQDELLTGHLDLDVDSSDDESFVCTANDVPVTIVTAVDRDSVSPEQIQVRYFNERADRYYRETERYPVDVIQALTLEDVEYPFTVWKSREQPRTAEAERVIEWAEIVAVDERTISIAFGFAEAGMVPDVEREEGYEVILEPVGSEGEGPTRTGLAISDADLAFAPPGVGPISVVDRDEFPVPGINYHPVMASTEFSGLHHSTASDADPAIDLLLSAAPGDLSWEVRTVDGEPALELVITAGE